VAGTLIGCGGVLHFVSFIAISVLQRCALFSEMQLSSCGAAMSPSCANAI